MTTLVRPAREEDVDAMCVSLAAAFEDDPVMNFLIPDGARRLDKLRRFFVQHLPHGGCYTTEDRVAGALWDPPGQWKMSNSAILRSMPTLVSVLGARSITALRTLAEIEKLHPQEPHWYLAVLGTAPDRQGKGLGSSLMAPVLEACDRDGLPAYLESSKDTNVPFYERHGFAVTREIPLPKGPTVWAMWRDPRPPE
jgi:ribosomal protein S18 acetylase RimI-like enzyme